MVKRKLYIISLDAFGASDLEFAKTLPHFQEILSRSALVKEVESVYPSLTYVAHTSIATGMNPNRHGIIHNTHRQPERQSPDWYWYAERNKEGDVVRCCKEGGIHNLCFAMAGDREKPFHRLQPLRKFFRNRPWQNQVMVSAFCIQHKICARDE